MKKYLLILLVLFYAAVIFAQQKPAYILYNADGKKVSCIIMKLTNHHNIFFR